MTIQLNTDKNLNIHESFDGESEGLLTSECREHIIGLEVHLSDENGGKVGQNDKRCMIEARLEGRQPIAFTADSHTHEKSVSAAIDKLKTSIDTILGRLRNH